MEQDQIITGNDSIVIIKCLEDMPGGKILDTTGFTPDIIQAGHIVIEDAEGQHKPMPVNGDGTAYDSLPASHTIVGVVKATILKRKPLAAVMVRGAINQVASPYPVTEAIKKALPLIRFTQD